MKFPCSFLLSFNLFQESISDFYWYYSGKDVIDEQGQRNFSKAINVAKQVFNTLTEYIQVRENTAVRIKYSQKINISDFKKWFNKLNKGVKQLCLVFKKKS